MCMCDQHQNQEREWTPGPWNATERPGYAGMGLVLTEATPIDGSPVHVAKCYDLDPAAWPGIGFMDANAELIALAPELAEAVLAVADCSCHGPLLDWEAGTFKIGKQEHGCYPDRDDCPHMQVLFDVADKLRQIGGAS